MISTLRALFLSRLLREKLLLVALAVLALAFWFSSFFGRARVFFADEQKASLALADQARWLSHRSQIEAEAERAASGFDPAKTLDATTLLGKVTELAGNAGLHNTSSAPPQDVPPTGQFAFHTVDFTVSRASWEDLRTFYYALQAQKPYIGIQKFVEVADPANPSLLNANITVASVEIIHGGAQ